jgi:serine-type D-Ala-D-Ala carboxypeptidase/endopeptidase
MRHGRVLVTVAAGLCFCSPLAWGGERNARPARSATSRFDLDRARATLSREIKLILKETGIPSISIALLKDDRVVWARAFGYSNLKLRVPATPDTIYSTGSCFKSVTALAVMQLVERGKLNLDAPVNDYLGNAPIKDRTSEGRPVTLRHLLSHHSGLRASDETADSNSKTVPLWETTLPKSLEELAAGLRSIEAPGTRHVYSNYGYALAGLIVQKVSGLSYERYIVENVLTPSGIESSGPFTPTPEMVEALALPYRLEGGKAHPEAQVRFDVYPAGAAYLSVPAMASVLLAHLNGGTTHGATLLRPESMGEIHRPQFGSAYGLGVGVREMNGEKLISHAGGIPGYSTHFLLAPDSKVGVYLAANAGAGSRLSYLAQLSVDLLRGKPIGTGLVRHIVGLGVALGADPGTGLLRITDVIPGSSASRAHLVPGLLIRQINGVSVKGKTVAECLGMMAVPAGTPVRLELVDPPDGEARTVALRRARFAMPG